MTTPEIAPQRASAREWIGLAVIALPCLLYSMDLTVLHLAVPKLSADLNPSSAELLWIIDIYGFLVAGSLITMGTLGDRIGRRKLLLVGAAAFAAASILAAFSTSAEMLIATRALLGLAGATVAPSTLSLIRNMFLDSHERTVAVSVWITSYSVGGAIGPLVGGLLLEHFWWGSVFLIAVPVMALLLVVGPRLLPEYRDPNAGKPDVASAALSLAAVLSVIFGLKTFAQDGITLPAIATLLLGLTLGAVFVKRQQLLDDPLIDLRLFTLPRFSASLAIYGLTILIMFGAFLFLPQYLQLVVGLSPFDAGLWTLPWALAFIVGSTATPFLVKRFSDRTLIVWGLLLAAPGFAVFTMIGESTSFLTFAAGSTLFSLAMSPVFTLTTDVVISSAPPERAGAASALSETSAEFNGALGIAVFGSLGVAIYRSMVSAHEAVSALPPESSDIVLATLAGAITVAGQLPPEVGEPILDIAREAFVRGLRICAMISVVGSLVLAAFAARVVNSE